jgi:hypothetical protein
MTHSNFPIWSKLLMYCLCKNALRAGRSQKRGRSLCTGRTTSSMGIVDVQATTLKTPG